MSFFQAHPATRIVRSRFAAVTIFAANRTSDPVGRIDAGEPEDALITRPGFEVVVRRLPDGGAEFLSALIAGEPLGVAADAALQACPSFDIGAAIAGMIEAGAFTSARDWRPPMTAVEQQATAGDRLRFAAVLVDRAIAG